MADFSALKTSIQNYIKQNGNEEITGNLLQQVLLSMVTTLGDSAINDLITALNNEVSARQNADGTLQTNINNEATARGNADTELGGRITTLQGVVNGIKTNVENGYVYAGIATPTSTPASGKVFYLALTAGTYTNFGATVVPQGINILKYNGSAWSLDSFLGLDDAPTQGSSNLVKSGGVLDSIIKDGSAFDLSAYNNGTTYADLSAALTALNALPAAYKKGGMSFKYVQTSDNKYVQWRLMANSFTTDVTQWQGVDDEPIVSSKNLVESGGVYLNTGDKITDEVNADYFAISDPLNKSILKLLSFLKVDKEGNIITKQQNTEGETYKSGIVLGDLQGKILLKIFGGIKIDEDGNITTNSFSSKNIPDADTINELVEDVSHIKSSLVGKKGIWLGTSIPGCGYPVKVGQLLGMNILNLARGSSMCRKGKEAVEDAFGDDLGISGLSWQNVVLSLSMSQDEKLRIFKRWTTANRKALMISEDGYTAEQVENVVGYGELLGGNFPGEDTHPTGVLPSNKPIDFMNDVYIESRKYCYSTSWNNSNDIESGFGAINGLIEPYLNENDFPDYWFIDHGHNDCVYSNITMDTFPEDKFNRNYFVGAMNFIINKILSFRHHTNIIIVGHYTNQQGATGRAQQVCPAQNAIANYWQFPIIKTWELLPFSQIMITTTGYWDADHIWHDTGYNGHNHVGNNYEGHDENPRQVDGVWVHDLTMKQIWMWDDLHPNTLETSNLYAKMLANSINKLYKV